jgi:threonine/homoserine/homoserine lactone efflux protein
VSDITVWIIALGFFAPIHYLGPGLVVLLSGEESTRQRRQLLRTIAIDCTLSMLIAFGLAIALFQRAPRLAALVFLGAALAPYLHLWLKRRGD